MNILERYEYLKSSVEKEIGPYNYPYGYKIIPDIKQDIHRLLFWATQSVSFYKSGYLYYSEEQGVIKINDLLIALNNLESKLIEYKLSV